MSEDTGVDAPVTWPVAEYAELRVRKMQIKLHRWAVADHGFRFDDVFNFVCDPATLVVAFERVAGNTGARTAGVDGLRADHVQAFGAEAYLEQIRSQLKAGVFRPMPVRERMIPKAGGKLRRLGIPTIADRVVQAALKLVMEPIFEACFDRIDHAALMGRVRVRLKDKRVLALVKAFLKAGIMTELGEQNETTSGTPQGGILSPLLANIALSALDDFAAEQWTNTMATRRDRERRRKHGLGTWRLVRYADDFVVMVHGTREHVEDLRGQVSEVLATMGLALSPSKTRIVHLADGFDFLGFRIVWSRKRGTDKWYVYTFIADKPVEALKRKIKSLTLRLSHLDYRVALIRINQIQRGWANYFKHAVAKHTLSRLATFIWWRVVHWVMHRNRMTWKAIRRWLHTPQGWGAIRMEGIELFNLATVPVTRYRYRGNSIPTPWPEA
ncbi:reverse transcriptase domain-containing protein [Streptomyces sp. NPDC059650]|uniref:reverse transcriptase domain-containing protein n=1 Tax=Streptomyces sp. NPDC059650 TaxID=3346896 RepID=UPI00369557D7